MENFKFLIKVLFIVIIIITTFLVLSLHNKFSEDEKYYANEDYCIQVLKGIYDLDDYCTVNGTDLYHYAPWDRED
jgi:hypothetical protein